MNSGAHSLFRVFHFLSFFGCIVWLYVDPSWEPVVVLLTCFAGFFRDEVHGVIGKNIFSLTPKSRLIRDLEFSKYSFTGNELINPRIIEDFYGWISDSGHQTVSIDIEASNKSNRFFGEISTSRTDKQQPKIESVHDDGWFRYQYLGCSFSGVHLLRTWRNTGGSSIFCDITMVTLSYDSSFEQDIGKNQKIQRYVIKLVGSLPLGDRYVGEVSYKFGILSIPSCNGLKTLRNKKSRLFIL